MNHILFVYTVLYSPLFGIQYVLRETLPVQIVSPNSPTLELIGFGLGLINYSIKTPKLNVVFTGV